MESDFDVVFNRKYLEEESREKRNIELPASEWTLRSMGTEVWEQCLDLEWELELLVTQDLTLPGQAEGDDVQLTGTVRFGSSKWIMEIGLQE